MYIAFSDAVDHIVIGTVIQEVKTSNIAREVSFNYVSETIIVMLQNMHVWV